MIYSAKTSAQLLSEPVHVELGPDQKHQLKPLDRTRDEPDTRKGLRRILDLMRDAQHWHNLPAFLTELQKAKRRIQPVEFERVARRASESGRQDMVMACVRQAKDTGLVLRELGVAREVMWSAHVRAMQAGWDEEGTRGALRQAELIMTQLDNKTHVGKLRLWDKDARRRPEVLGVLLELAAVRAARHLDGKDTDGKVKKYALPLLASWRIVKYQPEKVKEAVRPDAEAAMELQGLAPAWKGMELAVEVLKGEQGCEDVKRVLEEKLPPLREHLQEMEGLAAYASVGKNKKNKKKSEPRGLKWYRELKNV